MVETLTDFEKQLIYAAFYKHVNMSPREMEKIVGADPLPEADATLSTTERTLEASSSQALAVGPSGDAGYAGAPDHADAIQEPELLTEEQWVGRHLIRVKRAKKEFLVDADYVQMRNAVNYIRRHAARPPKNEDKLEEWRYNLRARGFDPDRESSAALLDSEDPLPAGQ